MRVGEQGVRCEDGESGRERVGDFMGRDGQNSSLSVQCVKVDLRIEVE